MQCCRCYSRTECDQGRITTCVIGHTLPCLSFDNLCCGGYTQIQIICEKHLKS